MIQNYFKIALRNFWKNSVYSTINILGLGIGMAGFIVILIYLNHELSYDQWNPELEKVYKISEKTDEEILSNTRAPLAGFLKEQDPLVANATRLSVYGDYEVLVSAGENKIYQKGLVEADSSFFHFFPYPFLQGDRSTAFNKLNSIIINQEVAAKLFGSKNPIGQTIRLHNAIDCEVTGIMDALSSPSHLQATMILLSPVEKSSNHWENFSYTTYVKTHRIVPVEELEKSVDRTYYEHRLKKDQMSFQDFRATGHQAGLFVDALQDLHRSPKNGASNIMTVSILLALSTLLLLSGTINFSNLSIATSMRRAKEVGVRKVMGASRKALFWQFLGEVALQCVVAFGIALLLVNILLPYFKQEFNIQLHLLQSGRLSVLFFWTALCLLAVIALSGLYPALFLSRYTTTRVLKGDHAGENKGFALRNALIVVQFTVSAFFVMAIVIINKQIQYMQTKDWGFSSEQVLRIQAPQKIREEQFDTFRNELLAIPGIIHVSKTTTVPGDLYADSTKWIFRHADQSIRLSSVKVSADYFNTLNIPLIQGRFFNETYSDQHTRSAIVNESGAKNLNLKNPIGSIIHFDGCDSIPVQIIGVVKDFNVSGFEQRIQPVIYTIGNEACAYQSGGAILLKLSGNNIATTVHSINQLWDKMEPDMPFRHSFLDENFRMLFANYIRLQWIVRFFGFTSVAIAMMGLFALTAFLVNQRTKEISIRKILGASLTDLGLLLSKDFIKLIALSVTLAIPLGWWAGSIWLQEFVYRISLNGWMFAIAGLSVLVIASITISLQTLKAALANPADSLRAE